MDKLIQYWRIFGGFIPLLLVFLVLTSVAFGIVYRNRIKANEKTALTKTILEACTFLSAAAIIFFTLLPLHGFRPNLLDLKVSMSELFTGDIESILCLVIYIPLGLTLFLGRRNHLISILIGFFLSLSVELLQYILPFGRIASINDLMLNTLGTILGVLIGVFVVRYSKKTESMSNNV